MVASAPTSSCFQQSGRSVAHKIRHFRPVILTFQPSAKKGGVLHNEPPKSCSLVVCNAQPSLATHASYGKKSECADSSELPTPYQPRPQGSLPERGIRQIVCLQRLLAIHDTSKKLSKPHTGGRPSTGFEACLCLTPRGGKQSALYLVLSIQCPSHDLLSKTREPTTTTGVRPTGG